MPNRSPRLGEYSIPRPKLVGCSIDPILEYLPDVRHWARLATVRLLDQINPSGLLALNLFG